ncbi:MAG: sensor histidine kinase [Longimicrobiales bacterium]
MLRQDAPAEATPGLAERHLERPARLLVVDDEPIVRETLRDLLEADGFEVLTAASGEEAFRILDDADLILLDGMLPGRDGWVICREIKQINPLLPILMVTARTSPEDVVRTFESGADDYIAKPFNTTELLARIRTRLRAHSTELALQEANRRFRQLAEQNYALYERARQDADERAALLHELDHRVRNNLSVILGLVTMERTRLADRSPDEALASLENRLRAFVLVHEAFRAENYRGIPLRPLLERIAQRLRGRYDPDERIRLQIQCGSVHLSERQGFALALVANELISNALRHAFPNGGGLVRVSCVHAGAGLRLDVADDGIGRNAGQPSALGSGESIVDALTHGELEGKLEIVDARPGTRVTIQFPLRPQLTDQQPESALQ